MLKKLLQVAVTAFALVNIAFAAVNVNTASQAELEALPGIGPVKAKAIIDDRQKNGSFKSVDDLKRVNGIGDKLAADLKDKVTVSGGAAPATGAKKPEAKK